VGDEDRASEDAGRELYDPLDPELVAARAHARDLCQALNATREAERKNGHRICANCSVRVETRSGCSRHSSRLRPNIELGGGVLQLQLLVLDVCRCTSVLHPFLSGGADFTTAMHPFNAELRRREEFGKPVEIGSDVWVGGGAIIFAGVYGSDRGQ